MSKIEIKHDSAAKTFLEGLTAGIPIGLGYFAVSFSLGIIAKHASLTRFRDVSRSFST